MSQTRDDASYAAVILDPRDQADSATLAELQADERICVLDHYAEQRTQLSTLRLPAAESLVTEPMRWAYYPWRRCVIAVLGPRGFRALRLDRNRNMITAAEQDRLGTLTIGVAGLSVGHIIAHTLVIQGLCGEIRLADFDTLELSNLNRVPATVFDLGVNKAVVAARRIAELDPYLPVQVFEAGLTPDTVQAFTDGLDIVIEECDSLDMKAVLRQAARERALPVLMATSDRGLVDIERFDLHPDRPILHGLLSDVDAALLPGMSNRDKVPHILRHLDAERLSARTAASLVEVDQSISTWPQLAADVNLGATTLAEAVRRIGLGERLESGRTRIDIASALDRLSEPEMAAAPPTTAPDQPQPRLGSVAAILANAAVRAPSGGNVQPWVIEADDRGVTIEIAPQHTSAMDVGFRGSAVAVGAALYNARIAAAAHGVLGSVTMECWDRTPLRARLSVGQDSDPALGALYPAMLNRTSNRHPGRSGALPDGAVEALQAAARGEGARLQVISDPEDLGTAADLLGASDRIRYLTARLHAEMISELRWAGDPDPDTGIEVRSLELDASDGAVLGILRRPDVMKHLAQWDAGSALGDFARDRVVGAAGLAVISTTGSELTDYARGGAATEAVWIHAEQLGLGVQPISPVFLYARTAEELSALSERYCDDLAELQSAFRTLAGIAADEEIVLVLRLVHAPAPSYPSRRDTTRVRVSPQG